MCVEFVLVALPRLDYVVGRRQTQLRVSPLTTYLATLSPPSNASVGSDTERAPVAQDVGRVLQQMSLRASEGAKYLRTRLEAIAAVIRGNYHRSHESTICRSQLTPTSQGELTRVGRVDSLRHPKFLSPPHVFAFRPFVVERAACPEGAKEKLSDRFVLPAPHSSERE